MGGRRDAPWGTPRSVSGLAGCRRGGGSPNVQLGPGGPLHSVPRRITNQVIVAMDDYVLNPFSCSRAAMRARIVVGG